MFKDFGVKLEISSIYLCDLKLLKPVSKERNQQIITFEQSSNYF